MRRALRWTARIGAAVVLLVVVGAGAVYALSERRLRVRFAVPEHALTVADDAASIERGRHLSTVRGCIDCHGAALGGQVLADDPALGRIAAANLTRGRRGGELSPAAWERAVRHGVRLDGSPLLVMPAHEYQVLSDEDLAAVVAYARSLPAVTAALPPARVGPVARALHLGGNFTLLAAEQIDHKAPHARSVAVEPTPTYGRYLASSCTGCHGPGLSGGKIAAGPPDWPPAANLTRAGIGHYSEADFMRAMRTGRRPSGAPIDSVMPYRAFKHMTDVELRALYAYLRTVPARPFGNR